MRDRKAAPTQVSASVPERTASTFSLAPPSCMAGNTSTCSWLPVRRATSFLNTCSTATLLGCSAAKLPAICSFCCAKAGTTADAKVKAAAAAKREIEGNGERFIMVVFRGRGRMDKDSGCAIEQSRDGWRQTAVRLDG